MKEKKSLKKPEVTGSCTSGFIYTKSDSLNNRIKVLIYTLFHEH